MAGDKIQTTDLQVLARLVRRVTYNAWGLAIGGDSYPNKKAIYERMKKPLPGDVVIETSTVWGGRGTTDLDSVGVLLRVEQEPVDFGPGGEPWDEKAEGRPHPTEAATYIRTFDGREFRWVNASFVAAPQDMKDV